MVDHQQILAFVAVAASGSVTKAAKVLGYSQPAVTHRIRALERQLGVRLFDRSTHPLRLTPEGRERVPIAEAIVLLTNLLSRRPDVPPDHRNGQHRPQVDHSVCE